MKTGITLLIALVLAGALAWWVVPHAAATSAVSSPPAATATTTASRNLSPDVYPLYSGVSWGSEQATTYDQYSGYQVTSAIQPDVTDIASISEPFEQYYATKLSAAGWSTDNSLAAGGAGSEMVAYQKGDDEILISYNSLFNMGSPNAPAQCPCEITLEIFSGSKSGSAK